VLGGEVPIVLAERGDSVESRIASCVLALVVALLPVLAFLLLLLLFDSFKLVPRAMIVSSLALGALAAMAALVLHAWLFDVTGLSTRAFARSVAPFTEEALKAKYKPGALKGKWVISAAAPEVTSGHAASWSARPASSRRRLLIIREVEAASFLHKGN